MTERHGDWIQTATGNKFWPLDPHPEDIHIEDIAHALSNLCRYAGHCREFYSVAQHSVLVSLVCGKQDALWGLLHDAAEAYLCDLPRPLKPFLTGYRQAEEAVMMCVAHKFGLSWPMPDSVKKADEVLLATEARDLMSPLQPEWEKWLSGWTPLPDQIKPVHPKMARTFFLGHYALLKVK